MASFSGGGEASARSRAEGRGWTPRALLPMQGRAGELGEAGPSGEPGVPVSTHTPHSAPWYRDPADTFPSPVGRCWRARGARRGWPQGLSGEWGVGGGGHWWGITPM